MDLDDERATPDPQDLLAVAVDAARAAGALLRDQRVGDEDLVAGAKSSPTDVVTVMDVAAERLIRDRVLAARPHDAFLGEESEATRGGSGGAPARVRWVVDPIDGTVNYLYRIPQWAVSVAARVDDVPVAGVVLDVMRDEEFVAVRGGGAWLNGRRLRVNPATRLGAALVGTGFGYTEARRRSQGRVIAEVVPRVRDVRRAGAASLDLCWVAAGRLDAYYERGTKPWDHAAASLVAREAGAWVGGLRGTGRTGTGADDEAFEQMLVVAAPGVSGELVALLESLRADTD